MKIFWKKNKVKSVVVAGFPKRVLAKRSKSRAR